MFPLGAIELSFFLPLIEFDQNSIFAMEVMHQLVL